MSRHDSLNENKLASLRGLHSKARKQKRGFRVVIPEIEYRVHLPKDLAARVLKEKAVREAMMAAEDADNETKSKSSSDNQQHSIRFDNWTRYDVKLDLPEFVT